METKLLLKQWVRYLVDIDYINPFFFHSLVTLLRSIINVPQFLFDHETLIHYACESTKLHNTLLNYIFKKNHQFFFSKFSNFSHEYLYSTLKY